MNLGSDDNGYFFFFFQRGGGGVLAGEGRNRWNDRREKMSRLKPDIRKSTGWMKCRFLQKLWNQPPLLPPPHALVSPVFWTTEDVICHISKVGEEARDCSPFRDAGILSLRRNISSRAHYYISPRQYWKQRVSSVSLCLSLAGPWREIILLNDVWGWLI